MSKSWWHWLLSCPCKGWTLTPEQITCLIKTISSSSGLLLRVKHLRALERQSSVITANWAVCNSQHAVLYNSKHSQRTVIACSLSEATFSAQQLERSAHKAAQSCSSFLLLRNTETYCTKNQIIMDKKTVDPPWFPFESLRFKHLVWLLQI